MHLPVFDAYWPTATCQLPASVESRCGAVVIGLVCLLPPLSSGGAQVPLP
jgi:hypothetical protein